MNKRIRELAEQAKLRPALLLKHWGAIDALTDSEQEELSQLEQFAELIVKDCALIAGLMEYEGRKNIGAAILDKFGVE